MRARAARDKLANLVFVCLCASVCVCVCVLWAQAMPTQSLSAVLMCNEDISNITARVLSMRACARRPLIVRPCGGARAQAQAQAQAQAAASTASANWHVTWLCLEQSKRRASLTPTIGRCSELDESAARRPALLRARLPAAGTITMHWQWPHLPTIHAMLWRCCKTAARLCATDKTDCVHPLVSRKGRSLVCGLDTCTRTHTQAPAHAQSPQHLHCKRCHHHRLRHRRRRRRCLCY